MNESAGFLAEDGKNSIRNELFSPTYKEEMIMVKRRKRAAKKAHKKTKARRKTRRTKARKTTAGKKGHKKAARRKTKRKSPKRRKSTHAAAIMAQE